MDLNHHLTQPFRVWLGGGFVGVIKRSVYINIYVHIYTYTYVHTFIYVYIERRSKAAGYEIRGFEKRDQPSQGERRIPTDTQGGRRKVGCHIRTYTHIYIYT